MSAGPTIAPARPGDVVALWPLVTAYFAHMGFETPEAEVRANLARMLDDENALVALACTPDAAVGFATATFTWSLEWGGCAELEDLYVVPDARGAGLGAALVRACEDWVRTAGGRFVWLTVTDASDTTGGLAGFYRALGYGEPERRIMLRALAPGAAND